MGGPEIEEFLTQLAVNRKVSASTQNQALNGVVFLFKYILGKEPGQFNAIRATRGKRLPLAGQQHSGIMGSAASRPKGGEHKSPARNHLAHEGRRLWRLRSR